MALNVADEEDGTWRKGEFGSRGQQRALNKYRSKPALAEIVSGCLNLLIVVPETSRSVDVMGSLYIQNPVLR